MCLEDPRHADIDKHPGGLPAHAGLRWVSLSGGVNTITNGADFLCKTSKFQEGKYALHCLPKLYKIV